MITFLTVCSLRFILITVLMTFDLSRTGFEFRREQLSLIEETF